MLQSSLYIPYIHKRYGAWSWRADKELTMPRIADYILNCVIYLYPTLEDAQQSKNVGGSGFLMGVKSKTGDFFYTYAVTNAHVINGGCPVIRINKKDGTLDYIAKTDSDWVRHPDGDDLAITGISLDQNTHKVDFFVSDDMFATKEKVGELDIGIGDEVFIAGRFQQADGKIQNTPTLRFGNIAQMPIEPHILDSGIAQEGYLVECHSISGFSGSPVFITIPPLTPRPNSETLTTVWHRLFLGIDLGHKLIKEKVLRLEEQTSEWKRDKKLKVLANSAMMVVVPAWKLKELLDQPQFMNPRDENDKKVEKDKKPIDKEEVVQADNLTLTEDEFKEALKKVSQKIKPSQPDASKPKT